MLPEVEYKHFLVLFVAVRLCSCDVYKSHLSIASKLFNLYVQQYATIYGRHTISSNVHNLIHVSQDLLYCNTGNLMNISTYKFENTLRLLSLKLKHTNRPLEQVVCRLTEQKELQISKTSFINYSSVHEPFGVKGFCETRHQNQPISIFKKILISKDVILSSRRDKDSWFMTKSKDIFKFKFALKDVCFKIYGQKIKQKGPFFINPITSTKLDIYISDGKFDDDEDDLINIESIDEQK